MSTVSPTPGVCQAGGNNCADNLSTALNAIGKWGTTFAGIATGRGVTVGQKGVAVSPSGCQVAKARSSYLPLVVIVVVAIVVIVLFRK
jgi:hypothetical protein